jgi:hypothetical protein
MAILENLSSPALILRQDEKIRTTHCSNPPCGYQTLFMRATGIIDFFVMFFLAGKKAG